MCIIMSENFVELSKENVQRIASLLDICPTSYFKAVPLKIVNSEDEGMYASIETVTPTGDMIFSAKVNLVDLDIALNTFMAIRLSINKATRDFIFGGKFDKVKIFKNRIIASNSNSEIVTMLFNLDKKDIHSFVFDVNEMYNNLLEEYNLTETDNIRFSAPSVDKLKELKNCISTLIEYKIVDLKATDSNSIDISISDYNDNKIRYTMDLEKGLLTLTENSETFEAEYDDKFVDILNNIVSNAQNFVANDIKYDTDIIVSNVLAVFSINTGDISAVTVVTSKERL